MKTLVLGASENPRRYSHIAIQLLEKHGYDAIGLGRTPGKVGSTDILNGKPELKNIHTVTLYLAEPHQFQYENYILETIQPKRIIFNPGAENPGFHNRAKENSIEVIDACTLVMLNTGQYF